MQTYTVVNENIIKDLAAIVGNKYVLTDKDRLVLYGQDEGAERKAYRLPEAVVLPATTEEVAAVMRLAVKHRIPVIPRGAGTGLEGGAVANEYGGIILSTERMNAVLEINDECLYARVEAGVITADLQRMAAAKGLLYAGDPCSGDSCFIGGNAATNAGGNRAVKYGTTRDQVYAVKMVTPKGEIVELVLYGICFRKSCHRSRRNFGNYYGSYCAAGSLAPCKRPYIVCFFIGTGGVVSGNRTT